MHDGPTFLGQCQRSFCSDDAASSIDQLQAAHGYQPQDHVELLQIDGVGPKSLRALALIGERVYDAEASREDPAKYASAHGGKDGTPHPVGRQRYDSSTAEIRRTLDRATVDSDTKQSALGGIQELSTTDG